MTLEMKIGRCATWGISSKGACLFLDEARTILGVAVFCVGVGVGVAILGCFCVIFSLDGREVFRGCAF